jgi:hypothetical protein
MHRKGIGALVVVLALALAGCGGSDSSSKTDFVKQANAACTKARTDAEKARGRGIVAFANRVLLYQRNKLKAIEAITPPDELKASYADFRVALSQRTDLIVGLVAQVKARKRISKQDERTFENLRAREEKAAMALGAIKCRERQASSSH